MKILIPVINFQYLTGAELYVHTLAAGLVKRGHDVTVCSFAVGGPIAKRTLASGARVYRFDKVPRERYDLIASQELLPTEWSLNAFPGTPIIHTVHSEFECERPLISPEISHYVYIRPTIRTRWGLPEDKSTLVYNPIDFSRFNREGVTDDGSILFVGSVYSCRRDASLDIIKRFPETHVYFVGDKSGGNYLDNIRSPYVHWLPGNVWAIEELTKRCHVTAGCMLGRSTIEGWACGKPGWIYELEEFKQNDYRVTSSALHEPPEDMTVFGKEHVVDQLEDIYQRHARRPIPSGQRVPQFDIIIPNYVTQALAPMILECLHSIREHSTDYRLLFVDNGSPALNFVKPELSRHSCVEVISADSNLGFVKAVNLGLQRSTAPYVIILNNDTRVCAGWLETLRDALTPPAGLAGPRSQPNGTISSTLPYRDTVLLPHGSMLVFFCVMIRREVIERIGFLDEDFGVGLGDDDDYCHRAEAAGFRLAFCGDIEVYHRHKATFNSLYTPRLIGRMGQDGERRLRDKRIEAENREALRAGKLDGRRRINVMRDRVIVPTFQRPELLWLCLERLFECQEVKDMDVYVYVDAHCGQPPPIEEIWRVIANVDAVNLRLRLMAPHSYDGNSYNVLTAYSEAYEDGCDRIFEIEDDVLVTPDFFTWQYRQFAKRSDWFAVVGAKNPRTRIPDSCKDAYETVGENLVSLGVGYPRETIKWVLPHIRPEYFSNPERYCKKTFPQFHIAGAEQDGLLQRIMLEDPRPIAWAAPVRAWHAGWWGYSRKDTQRPQGTLEERVVQVREIIADPKRLHEISCADDVEVGV
jgi:GT2 family glycosyltransferase